MTWQEIHSQYPNTWLLLETIKAYSEKEARILKRLMVISSFKDSTSALEASVRWSENHPQREFLVLHTIHDNLAIKKRLGM